MMNCGFCQTEIYEGYSSIFAGVHCCNYCFHDKMNELCDKFLNKEVE